MGFFINFNTLTLSSDADACTHHYSLSSLSNIFPHTYSHKLHKGVVQKLIREGIDQCNVAITRFHSERKSNRDCYRKSRSKRDQSDARVFQLNDDITELDRAVTALRKKIDELSSSGLSSSGYDVFTDGVDSDDASLGRTTSQPASKRRVAEKQWDHHQHASKKRRKTSFKKNKQHVTQQSRKRRVNGERRNEKFISSERAKSNNEARRSGVGRTTSKRATSRQMQRKEMKGHDDSAGFEFMPVDFVGETDENDVHPLPSRNQQSRQTQLSRINSGNIRHANERAYSRNKTQANNRRNNAHNDTRGLTHSQIHTSRSDGTETNAQHGVRADMRHPSQSWKEQQDDLARRHLIEPPLPMSLSTANIFQSLASVVKVPVHEYINQTLPSSQLANGGVSYLCSAIAENYPNDIKACWGLVSDLLPHVQKDLSDEDSCLIFRAMLAIFQKRCSTFLDLLCFNTEEGCLHIKCWTLVFKMIQHKLHNRLEEKDGLAFSIFKNSAVLVNHILHQMIDCLYSQLLWQEWGAIERFNEQIINCFAELRDDIGAVSPLPKLVADIIRVKFGPQNWHRSKMTDEKENDRSKMYFVSAINPDDHAQFLMTGQRKSTAEGET